MGTKINIWAIWIAVPTHSTAQNACQKFHLAKNEAVQEKWCSVVLFLCPTIWGAPARSLFWYSVLASLHWGIHLLTVYNIALSKHSWVLVAQTKVGGCTEKFMQCFYFIVSNKHPPTPNFVNSVDLWSSCNYLPFKIHHIVCCMTHVWQTLDVEIGGRCFDFHVSYCVHTRYILKSTLLQWNLSRLTSDWDYSTSLYRQMGRDAVFVHSTYKAWHSAWHLRWYTVSGTNAARSISVCSWAHRTKSVLRWSEVFKSCGQLMWPIEMAVTSLPPKIRMNADNLLLGGVWLAGPVKPDMKVILKPILNKIKELNLHGVTVKMQNRWKAASYLVYMIYQQRLWLQIWHNTMAGSVVRTALTKVSIPLTVHYMTNAQPSKS